MVGSMKITAALLGMGLVLVLAGCVTTPEEDPVETRLNDLDARVGRIDRVVANQSLLQLAQRVDSLQGEVRTLSGRIEELQNDNATLRKQQRDLYADLEKRVASSVAASTPAVAATPAMPATGADEQTRYNQAFEQLKSGKYDVAIASFGGLASAFPNGQLADNTQYWLGEAYYVTQDLDHAAVTFQGLLARWPQSRKAPDAQLKLGYTQIKQNKLAAGKASLALVVTKYPGSDAAKLAASRLAELPK
jgi:tol-pal system protein YbgF